jgi:hypothetical protein
LASGEGVVICVDDAAVAVKAEKGVVLKAPPAHVHAEAEPIGGAVRLKTRQGGGAVVLITEKRIAGSAKLTAEQARDIFMDTITAFSTKKKE